MVITRSGWTVLVGSGLLLVTARTFGLLELFVCGSAGVLTVLAALIWARTTRLRIEVEREVTPAKAHAGSSSTVQLTVRNVGTRRTPVARLRDPLSTGVEANLLLAPLKPGDECDVTYALPTTRRGILRIGPLTLEMSDPLGLARVSTTATPLTDVTVLPQVFPLDAVPRAAGEEAIDAQLHRNTLGRSSEDFHSLRPYVVGDDTRRIHWPSTARRDEAVVRQLEVHHQRRTTIMLDTRASAYRGQAFELAVSAAASIIELCRTEDDLIRVVTTDGIDTGLVAGSSGADGMLEHLALVEPAHGQLSTTARRLRQGASGGTLVSCVGDLHPDDWITMLAAATGFGDHLVVAASTAATPSVGGGRSTRVVTATDGANFTSEWRDAVRLLRRGSRAVTAR